MNKFIDKGFRSCRFVSTIVKHPVLSEGTISFVFHCHSFLCTMKTLIIGYELNNITIKPTL